MWKQLVNALLGVIVIAIPFLSLSAETLTWSLAIAGLVIATLSVWSIADMSSIREDSGRLVHH